MCCKKASMSSSRTFERKGIFLKSPSWNKGGGEAATGVFSPELVPLLYEKKYKNKKSKGNKEILFASYY